MQPTVESYCNLLVRSRLLKPDDARAVYQRWQREAGDQAAFVGRFAQWLVAGGHLTTYQASRLARGRAEGYFIDQYKVLDKIPHGPLAGMYRGVHQLGQMVAIKVLSSGKAKSKRHAARFLNEARLALRLKHPNVIRTFQVGQADERYFQVLEHVEGETLAEVLQRRGRLPPVEAVRLVHQALLGLQHLHEQGIIHRDLKPGNLVLVGSAPQTDQPESTLHKSVKIVDIDLGRGLPEYVGPGGQSLVGTPDYLAPEQARDPRAVDIRADIYSLGCVLYHALAGQPPFPDTNVLQQMQRHATETPRLLREFNPAVPDGLQQIINWMLAKEPAQRYPTPERAAQALQVFLASGSELAAPPGTDPRLKSYLNWLETSDHAKHATEPQLPQAAPGPTLVIALPEPERKTKRKRTGVKVETAPAAPVLAPVAPVAFVPTTFDVELVPYEQPVPPRPKPRPLTELDRRDFLMMGLGGGGALLAIFCGWLLARLLRRSPEPAGESE